MEHNYNRFKFYNFLVDYSIKHQQEIIQAVKKVTGKRMDYESAADYVYEHISDFDMAIIELCYQTDQFLDYVDVTKDRIDAIYDYINDWSDHIHAFKITAMGVGTYLDVDTSIFIDSKGKLNFGSKLAKYDRYQVLNDKLINRYVYNLQDVPPVVRIRLGETDSKISIPVHYQFVELLKASGIAVGSLDNVKADEFIEFDSCDVEVIVNA